MIFYIIAILVIASAILVVTSRNPIISALWLVACLFVQAVLFVTMDAHLVAALQVLLYAGAIMVLILFVIMMLNLGPGPLKFKAITGERVIIASGALYLAGVLGMAIWIIYKTGQTSAGGGPASGGVQGTVEAVGRLLLTKYLIPFELVSVLLLAAIVGAVVIARDKGQETRD